MGGGTSGGGRNAQGPSEGPLAGGTAYAEEAGLRLRDVARSFPGATRFLFRALSAHFPAGSRVGVMGTNGSGKTSLARILCGLDVPDEGQVTLNGRTVTGLKGSAAAGFQLVVQESHTPFHPRMTPLDILRETSVVHRLGLSGGDLDDALARVGLSHRAGTPSRWLSGGQSRRLAVLRALLVGPEVLILDEPSTGMDLLTQAMVTELVEAMAPAESIVIWISHDLDLLRRCAHHIWLMEDGKWSLVVDPDRPGRPQGLEPDHSGLWRAWEALNV